MLVACWSPKGGSGTSVVTAACALVLARRRGPAPVRLVDLDGDQSAILGLADEPPTGVADWLLAGPTAPTEALDRLAVPVIEGLSLLPWGGSGAVGSQPAAEAGAALAVALREGPGVAVLDAGRAGSPAARAATELADRSVVVVRGCYLTLRRAARHPLTERAAGVVVVEESGRSITARDVRAVLDRPVLAHVSARADVARAVDAGVLAARTPDSLARAAAAVLDALRVLPRRRGQAA
ncbi:MAG: hypothetical protein U0V73_01395 [Acidimicrobiia bacterium]